MYWIITLLLFSKNKFQEKQVCIYGFIRFYSYSSVSLFSCFPLRVWKERACVYLKIFLLHYWRCEAARKWNVNNKVYWPLKIHLSFQIFDLNWLLSTGFPIQYLLESLRQIYWKQKNWFLRIEVEFMNKWFEVMPSLFFRKQYWCRI